jgi:hypothetical protein
MRVKEIRLILWDSGIARGRESDSAPSFATLCALWLQLLPAFRSAGTSGACLYSMQAEGKWHGSAKIIDIIIIIKPNHYYYTSLQNCNRI